MRINTTFEVSDEARHYIAALAGGETTDKGAATRESVIAYVQAMLNRLSSDFQGLPTGKVSEEEAGDAKDAVDYLRRLGRTEGQIRAWLYLQRARLNFHPWRRPWKPT